MGSIKQGLSCSGGSVYNSVDNSMPRAAAGGGHARASSPAPLSHSLPPPQEGGVARAPNIAGDSGNGAGSESHRRQRPFPQFAGDCAPPAPHAPCEGRGGRGQVPRAAAGCHQFDFEVTYSL